MPSLRIPLVGSQTDRNPNAAITDSVDQQFTNCFPEIITNQITGKRELWLNKRQGSTASADVQASATGQYGAIVWTTTSSFTPRIIFSFLKSTGTSVMFFNEALGQIGADIPNALGCSFMAETSINATGHLTASIVDNPTVALEAWYYPEGGAWTQITSGAFPSNILESHAHMDGYMFVMARNGNLHNSDLNSVANWTANNYLRMSGGGTGLGCVRHGSFIVGFTDYTTELFYNAGNATGSVLGRVRDGIFRVGAQRSDVPLGAYFRTIGETLYWEGDSQTSTSAVSVSYSDDDFSTFTSAGSIDLNTVPPVKLTRLGLVT
jgi:hypothetical protein